MIHPTIHKAKVQLVLAYPFYATLLLTRLRIIEDPTCKTFYTDGRVIGYNADFADSLTLDGVKAVLAHEVLHVALMHTVRRGSRDPKKWNIACDYAVNLLLHADKFHLPIGGLLDMKYTNMMAEAIYAMLPDSNNDGQSDDPGGMGEVRDTKPEDGQTQQQVTDELRQGVQQAATAAEMQGKLGSAAKLAILGSIEPTVNWRDTLQQFVCQMARDDYSWKRINTRYSTGGVLLPSLYNEALPPIVVAIDTSGSINQQALSHFIAEIQAIADQWQTEIHVIQCDTQIRGEQRFAPGEKIEFDVLGGGGTRFSPVMKRVVELDEASFLLYFTDLCCSDFGEDPGIPVVWVEVVHNRLREHKVPFGQIIRMEL